MACKIEGRTFQPIVLAPLVILLILSSCGQEPAPANTTRNFSVMDDTMLNYNKGVMMTEDREIEDFMVRYQWEMEKSPTGLRYMIYTKGNGKKAERGKIASLKFSVKLLNGNLCYSSATDGLKTFRIGRGGIESGLEEGILLLKVGDRAKFILPSHLAFGLLGDQNKIPQNATLVYDVELVEIKQP